MNVNISIATVRGPKNHRESKHNQDAILKRVWRDHWLVVVCDGMGSRPYASLGSHLACKAVCTTLRETNFNEPEKSVVKRIYQQWLMYLKDHLPHTPPKDAATTCLFAWGDSSGKVRLFQLGDGAIYYMTDTFGVNHEKSDNMFGNETTALGYSIRWQDWTYREIQLDFGATITLMTDGISDDIDEPQQFLDFLSDKFIAISPRQGKKYLINELNNWQTPHHSDDKSIGVIIWKKQHGSSTKE